MISRKGLRWRARMSGTRLESSMRPAIFRPARVLVAASLGVLVAFAATRLTWPLLQPTPLALFYAAVLVGARLGGLGGGALAVVLSAASGYYAFLPPYGGFGAEPKQLVAIAVFVLIASALVWLLVDQQRGAAREREQRRWFKGTLA